MPSALIAERSKVFKKEEAESAIYICNGAAGASCGASPDHAPDVMKILLPPPDSFLGDVFAAFFARASAVVVMVVAAALLPPPLLLPLPLLLLPAVLTSPPPLPPADEEHRYWERAKRGRAG